MKTKLTAMILALCAMFGVHAANVRLYVSAPSEVEWGGNWVCYAWKGSDSLLGAWPGTQAVNA